MRCHAALSYRRGCVAFHFFSHLLTSLQEDFLLALTVSMSRLSDGALGKL